MVNISNYYILILKKNKNTCHIIVYQTYYNFLLLLEDFFIQRLLTP